jgi:hypothetical protein
MYYRTAAHPYKPHSTSSTEAISYIRNTLVSAPQIAHPRPHLPLCPHASFVNVVAVLDLLLAPPKPLFAHRIKHHKPRLALPALRPARSL